MKYTPEQLTLQHSMTICQGHADALQDALQDMQRSSWLCWSGFKAKIAPSPRQSSGSSYQINLSLRAPTRNPCRRCMDAGLGLAPDLIRGPA